jgi:hypothetical protein
MKVEVYSIDSVSLERVHRWDDSAFLNGIRNTQNLGDIFDVVIEAGGTEFSGFARSLYNVVLDLLINHRLLLSGKDFRYFVSDEPLFSVSQGHGRLTLSYYDRSNREVVIDESLSDVDKVLTTRCCFGIDLLEELDPSISDRIFGHAYEDLASANRAAFVGSR